MDEFALCWNNFADNIASGFQNLYDRGDLVDVTIACDGKLLKAHKIVLAICSPYFQEMFMSNPCKHPIVVLKDVSVNVMQELLQFMYQGEVNVKHSELQCFMKIAETLQIKGLTASHKNDRSPTPSAGLTPVLAHRSSSTSQLDPSKLNSYLTAAAKENLKRAAEATPEAFIGGYPIKAIKRSSDSIDQDSNSDCMDNLSSDEAFIPASPQISMIEQSSSTATPSARQFDLANVKRETGAEGLSSPQQSPTNLATSAAAMGAAAAAAAAMKLGFSSTPTSASAALHPMFGGFDHTNSSFSGIATSLASISGNGSNSGPVSVAAGATGTGPGAGALKLISMDYSGDYGSDYGKGGVPPGHMDIPADLTNHWNYIDEYVSAFEPVFVCTNKMQAKHVSLSDFYVHWLNTVMQVGLLTNSNLAKSLVLSLTERLKPLKNNMAFKAALLVDPRFNYLNSKTLSPEDKEQTRSFMLATWERIKQLDPKSSKEHQDTAQQSKPTNSFDTFLTRLFGGLPPESDQNTKPLIQQLNALDLEDHQSFSFDVWSHWKNRQKTYPELSKLALVFLSVPSNQVNVERSFSGMALTLTERRTNLSEESLENILLIKLNVDLIDKIIPENGFE